MGADKGVTAGLALSLAIAFQVHKDAHAGHRIAAGRQGPVHS
jgi:hypothetical protein